MVNLYEKIDTTLFGKYNHGNIYDQYISELKNEILGSCNTVLDVGCGTNSPVQHLRNEVEKTTGVDIFEGALKESRSKNLHTDYKQLDVLKIAEEFGKNSYDCTIASDVIEHLEKDDGYKLIEQMETVARKKVIIFTPNGFVPQTTYGGNTFQEHLSGWTAQEMQKRGYKVIGLSGPKYFRGERAQVTWKPSLFWARLSDMTQPIVKNNPQLAYQILCIKDV